MIENEKAISTPVDNVHYYDIDWRSKIAQEYVHEYEPTLWLTDSFIYEQVNYLEAMSEPEIAELITDSLISESAEFEALFGPILKANSIYSSIGSEYSFKHRIEALLLCPETDYQFIGNLFCINGEVIETFEKLFYNIRDNKGKLLPQRGILEHFATFGAAITHKTDQPTLWRLIAVRGGAAELLRFWGWDIAAEGIVSNIDDKQVALSSLRFIYTSVLDRILRNTLDSKSFVQLLSDLNSKITDLRDKGLLSDQEEVTEDSLLIKIVQLTAPKLITFDEDAKRELEDKLEHKLDIVKKGGLGGGKKETALEVIDKQIKDKITK